MGFRSKLGFTLKTDVDHGVAMVMQSDGTVDTVTDANAEVVIGWTEGANVAGSAITVRNMYDGTIDVKVTLGSSIVRGTKLYLLDDGTMTDTVQAWVHQGIAIADLDTGAPRVEAVIIRHSAQFE